MFPALSISVIASEGHVNSTLGRVARGIGKDLVFLNGMAEAILVKREWLVLILWRANCSTLKLWTMPKSNWLL